MTITVDGEDVEIPDALWASIKSACLLTGHSPAELIAELLSTYAYELFEGIKKRGVS